MLYIDALNLINLAIKYNILEEKDGRILVYREESPVSKEGWYLEDKDTVTKELMEDKYGQKLIIDTLKEKEVNFSRLIDFKIGDNTKSLIPKLHLDNISKKQFKGGRIMHVDGYIRFAVDPTGEKTWVIDYVTNDMVLKWHLDEFVGEDAEDLVDLSQVKKINSDIKNALVLVTFAYKTVSSFNGETTEYDNESTVRDVIVLDTNYKETWRQNLTTMYGDSSEESLENNRCKLDIAEWEEFYDDDFEFIKEEKQPLILI